MFTFTISFYYQMNREVCYCHLFLAHALTTWPSHSGLVTGAQLGGCPVYAGFAKGKRELSVSTAMRLTLEADGHRSCSSAGATLAPRRHWPGLVFRTGSALLASSGRRPGMPLNTLSGIGLPPDRGDLPQMSVAPRMRNPSGACGPQGQAHWLSGEEHFGTFA